MNEQNPRRSFFKVACVLGASTFLTPKPQLNARQNLKSQSLWSDGVKKANKALKKIVSILGKF